MDYFSLFGLNKTFELDLHTLEQAYKQLLSLCHPDKYAGKSDFEQKQALMMASNINEAYRVLEHPLNRAAYLLQLAGIEAESEQQTHFPTEFLMQQMQWREDIDEAKQNDDHEQLLKITQEIQSDFDLLIVKINQAINQNDDENAAALVRQGRFLDKILAQL